MPGNTLDHPFIDDHNIAERFVKGELPQPERESFERHYVDCPECMDRVALAQIFQTEAPKPKPVVGVFNVLATFTPSQQALIFAASTLALLLMPVFAMSWFGNRTVAPQIETEPVIQLPATGSVEAHIPANTNWISLSATVPDSVQGTYRISIVDVSERPLVVGPDQTPSQGTALGLRLPALPAGINIAVVEKKAENGAYATLSRHPLLIEWR